MKAISIIEKLINQVEEDYCDNESGCTDCPKYIGCAILEAKNYLAEELGFEEDE